MKLSLPIYDTAPMDIKDNRAMIDASALGLRPGQVPYRPMYDDAIDVGLSLRSHVTGKVIDMYLVEDGGENDDGEVHGWTFRATHECIQKNPRLETFELVIMND